jgi:DNA-binding transcriptional LysR family regulator
MIIIIFMTPLADLEIFARVVMTGSMTKAAKELAVSPAVISKRLKRLEERLGARLMQRTTRQLALTEEGQGFYERVVAILASVDEAEGYVMGRNTQARGTLRVSASSSFGRKHIAPHLMKFMLANPDLNIQLELSDSFVDIVGEGYDVAIRIAELDNSSLVARKLAANHRFLVASPEYLVKHGEPTSLADLAKHTLLVHGSDHWRLESASGITTVRVNSHLKTNSSEVVREAVIAGMGIALRSTWDIGDDMRKGRLVKVLPDYHASSRVAIYAVYPTRRFLPQKVRLFIDWLADLYAPVPPWDVGLDL